MKRLNFFEKIVFLLNSIVATSLLLSYILPYLPPKSFSVLAVLGLAVPFLLLVNLIFVLYWLLQLKRPWILSAVVLLIGFSHIKSSFNFKSD
ncbi:MAG: endonuclease, partial [Bacteroidota bacterium]|nr:endonuclease [Bacteroidota bacterium]